MRDLINELPENEFDRRVYMYRKGSENGIKLKKTGEETYNKYQISLDDFLEKHYESKLTPTEKRVFRAGFITGGNFAQIKDNRQRNESSYLINLLREAFKRLKPIQKDFSFHSKVPENLTENRIHEFGFSVAIDLRKKGLYDTARLDEIVKKLNLIPQQGTQFSAGFIDAAIE